MSELTITPTPKTPAITFNPASGTLEIKGRSIPENSVEFYKPVMDKLEEYSGAPKNSTTVNIQLEYFNTSSSKCLLDIFKRLEQIHRKGSPVQVNWWYEEDDEDMQEAGEDYQAIIQIPFRISKME
jgi:hypothetical protein